MSQMTFEQHCAEIKALLAPAAADLERVRDGSLAALRARVDAAIADGVPASRLPRELTLPGTFTRAEGICVIDDALMRLRRDEWLS